MSPRPSTERENLPWKDMLVSMWSKKGIPVRTAGSAAVSGSSVREMSVSRVFRSIFTLRDATSRSTFHR